MVLQHCSRPIERQRRLLEEISLLEKIEDDNEAQALTDRLKYYIGKLFSFDIINSDDMSNLQSKLSAAQERRRKKT